MTLELLRLPGLQYSSEHKTLVASPALLSNTDVIVPLLKLAARAAKPLKLDDIRGQARKTDKTCARPHIVHFEISDFGF